ncbi:transcription factor MUTE [Sorghum bicolor]|uniref:BHLH domain-containing protein n=1 Tax=Sorghum bicolor TaxID=4558 RepID=A0A1B6PAN7_SORBI|nr:transcription factor MUTE [Sorghum bicolor]KXG22733.1 hypothetical protein SORBI_3009G260200 [Sorghum bicolor]|eukprot:XP_021304028.1 transcription factor MUTE [Sorghum bicolor]
MSHIAVERNRRRQMNEHLKVLRSLTPGLYIKRGDQASIIGGAIEFIKELQQVLESLEARKKRRSGGSFISRTSSSPSPTPSPRSHFLSSGSSSAASSSTTTMATPSPPVATTTMIKELAACCNSAVADVEAKISGSNVLLRTLSRRIPGQAVRMIAVLEGLHLEVLHLNISTMEDTVLHSFVLKIGLECQLSVEDLAYEVQQTFVVVCCRDGDLELPEPADQSQENHRLMMYSSAMAI